MAQHHLRSTSGPGTALEVDPSIAGWTSLSFSVLALAGPSERIVETGDREVAVVLLEGTIQAIVGAERFSLSRAGVFEAMAHVLYVPPGQTIRLETEGPAEVAVGGAPAEGRYPVRLFRPEEMRSEVRGGGGATRQVNHILAHPLALPRRL